jgi:hypothetical protein
MELAAAEGPDVFRDDAGGPARQRGHERRISVMKVPSRVTKAAPGS